MLPPPSESQSTGASVALGGAALAASAMLAGIALRNKSPLPLAAGLAAAAASLSLMKKPKDEGTDEEDLTQHPECIPASPSGHSSKFQILDESDLNEEEEEENVPSSDWVDTDAVVFEHAMIAGSAAPATLFPSALSLPSQATSFPLLDDDGQVILGHQMLPSPMPAAFVETADEFGFPLGPLIWEPETEESSQICMEPEGGILWFSSSGIAPPPPAQLAREFVIPMSAALSLPASVAAPARPVLSENRNGSEKPSASASPESVASILESLRELAAQKGEAVGYVASGVPVNATSQAGSSAASDGCTVPQAPLSFADWMLSTQQGAGAATPPMSGSKPVPIAPLARTTLPSARRAGEVPKFTADDEPGEAHRRAGNSGLKSRVPAGVQTPATQPQDPALVYHRSVAPMAPVHSEETSERSRPLTVILVTLILMMVLLAVAIWGDGYLPPREASPPPWSQELVPATEHSTAAAVPSP